MPRLVVLELVLLQFLHLSGRVLRQTVDLLLLAFQPLAQGFLEPLHFVLGQRRGLLLPALLTGLLTLLLFAHLTLGLTLLIGAAGHLLAGWLLRLGSRTDFVQPIIQRVPLHIQDFFELALDVVEDRGQVEAFELLATLLPQSLQQVAHAVGAVAVGRANPALHHVAQRLL